MDNSEKKFDIEEGFGRVEELLGRMENGQVGLNELMEMYKDGISILKKCNETIENVEKELADSMKNEKGYVEVKD